MKNILFIVFAMLFMMTAEAQLKQLNFRTDGYYYYDNKCDTIILTQMDPLIKLEFIEKLSKAGITVGYLDCVPEGQMVIIGGSEIDIIMFLTKTGTYEQYEQHCWSPSVYKKRLQEMQNRQMAYINGTDRKNVQNIMLNTDNTFYNLSGVLKVSGTLYRDSIVLTQSLPEQMGFKFWKGSRTYRFYKFDQCPPTRDKLIYVYKDPFKE